MDFDEDELLTGALGDVGGLMGPHARRGAERSARRLRKDVLEVDLVVSLSAQQAAGRARQVIGQYGRVLSPEDPGDVCISRRPLINHERKRLSVTRQYNRLCATAGTTKLHRRHQELTRSAL